MTSRDGKTAIFIDGANLNATGRALGLDVDFKRLLVEFQRSSTLVRAFYYSAIAQEGEFAAVKPLLDWLNYNGYTVVTKVIKDYVDADGRRKVKGNLDIELVVNAMELAAYVEQIVIISGDGAFCALVGALQRRGVRVSVVSSIATHPPMIASELRRQADAFVDLKDLKGKIGRVA